VAPLTPLPRFFTRRFLQPEGFVTRDFARRAIIFFITTTLFLSWSSFCRFSRFRRAAVAYFVLVDAILFLIRQSFFAAAWR